MIRSLLIILAIVSVSWVPARALAQGQTKTETFDKDPGWVGVNNRSAHEKPPVTVRQDFGFSRTNHAGGAKAGEVGGFVTPAAETAYYAATIPAATFADKLTASGTMAVPDGEFHLLLGFFNSGTVNEWRTPNSIALRLNGRGNSFIAYPEFLTAKWRIATIEDPRAKGFGTSKFASGGKQYKWSLTYDPKGNAGKPMITASIGDQTIVEFPDPAYLADGGTFDRFGILSVMKSADTGGEFYIDDVVINDKAENFDADPNWDARGNRRTYPSKNVRFHFDFGHSPDTHFAGGKAKGELGGVIFRGDCRYPHTMASYGDKVGPLKLDKPFKSSGKLAFTRGVTDSGALIGFYHSAKSMEVSNRQDSGSPKCFVGFVIEGPSMEGFFVYPSYRMDGDEQGSAARAADPLRIYPDGKPHDWTLEYDPGAAAGGNGRITVTLDGKAVQCDVPAAHKTAGTTFDRFGIVTSWIDGNSVDAYFDDITYTVSQP
jgi:hypothetical protein